MQHSKWPVASEVAFMSIYTRKKVTGELRGLGEIRWALSACEKPSAAGWCGAGSEAPGCSASWVSNVLEGCLYPGPGTEDAGNSGTETRTCNCCPARVPKELAQISLWIGPDMCLGGRFKTAQLGPTPTLELQERATAIPLRQGHSPHPGFGDPSAHATQRRSPHWGVPAQALVTKHLQCPRCWSATPVGWAGFYSSGGCKHFAKWLGPSLKTSCAWCWLSFLCHPETDSLDVSTLPDTGLVLIGVALLKLALWASKGNHAAEPCPGDFKMV